MSDALNMSLDDIIKTNKRSGGGGSGRGRGGGARQSSGPGPSRRFPNRGPNRSAPYALGKPVQAPDAAWRHDMFADPLVAVAAAQGGRASGIETGTKLYISNLDYGVSNEDIKIFSSVRLFLAQTFISRLKVELFSEVGDLKRHGVHYDRSGRSKGTAEVVFSRRTDAAAAVKRYNNVQLDGKPMKIEIVGTNVVSGAPLPAITNGILGTPYGIPRGGQPRGRASTRLRGGGGSGSIGGGGRGFGRGRGRGRGRSEPVSAEDLDAELEKYHSESMQIN